MEKKKIAIIEMETHSFLLEQWYRILKEIDSVSFHFFVHPKVYKALSIIPKDYISVCEVMDSVYLKEFDWVVINTFHRHFEKYQTIFQEKPVLCLVHNLNFSVNGKLPKWKYFFQNKNALLYFLKLYLKEKIVPKRNLIYKAKRLGVLSNELAHNIKISETIWNGEIDVIPLNFVTFHTKIETEDTIQIVIPGNISRKRKDIDLVFSVLKRIKPNSKLRFVFLGKPENLKIKQELVGLQFLLHQNITIDFFESFIESQVFAAEMQKAHLLFCPIKEKTSFYGVEELYGKTKVSGNEGDCIMYGKIGLFPSFYPNFDWHTLFYSNEENLIQFFNHLDFERVKVEYKKVSVYRERYSFETIKNNVEQLLFRIENVGNPN